MPEEPPPHTREVMQPGSSRSTRTSYARPDGPALADEAITIHALETRALSLERVERTYGEELELIVE